MTDDWTTKERPPINGLRLVDVGGMRKLGLDIARQDGVPVAVVGPGAVDCRRCAAKNGLPCVDKRERAIEYPHLERVADMHKEINRLLKEAGER